MLRCNLFRRAYFSAYFSAYFTDLISPLVLVIVNRLDQGYGPSDNRAESLTLLTLGSISPNPNPGSQPRDCNLSIAFHPRLRPPDPSGTELTPWLNEGLQSSN